MADANSTAESDFPVYHPTTEQIRRWDRQDRAMNAFYVTYWQVVEDRRMPDGRRYRGIPLSRMFATRQECRRAYAEIKGKNPRAYRMRGTFLLHSRDAKDIAFRRKVLWEIRGLNVGGEAENRA
jgi:hypothetical protein